MKLIIAGGRDFNESKLFHLSLLEITTNYNITEVVCGKAKGADTMGELWAKYHDISIKEFPANWELGRGAGHIRNKQMGDYADILVAFWDGKSKGTEQMINYMKKLGKIVIVKRYNQGEDDEW